jgi:Protein of unknown function (DUF1552)
MFITKKSLARRTFLRGLGAAVALPVLDAMVPALTVSAKTAANPKLRFGAIYIPHGKIMKMWTPAVTGSGFEFTPILKPLEPFKDQLVVVSGLQRGGEADHAVACASWLSGAVPKKTEGQDFRLSTTIDQIIAKQIGQDTVFPSLELATEDFTGYVGGCSPGYACAYMNTLAWSTPTTPLPTEINPRVVFERLLGRPGTSAQRAARLRRDHSILDSIAEDAKDLRRVLGTNDRARLNQYFDDIREIERRIQRTEEQNGTRVANLDAPMGVPEAYEEHVSLLFDLATVAYQADLTRVFTFMMAREASGKTYPQIGLTDTHHALSHHGEKPQKIAEHAKLNVFHVTQFAKFIEKMRATPDGDGSLFDHSLVLYGSGMSNGNAHSGGPLPLAALGGGVGKGYRHIQTAEHTPIGDMWVGLAEKFGCQIQSIGESKGKVEI